MMRGSGITTIGALIVCAAGVTLVGAGQQTAAQQAQPPAGLGQAPGGLPLPSARTIARERVERHAGIRGLVYTRRTAASGLLVGYFNRNTKQEFDIRQGPEQPRRNTGGPNQGQPTHFNPAAAGASSRSACRRTSPGRT